MEKRANIRRVEVSRAASHKNWGRGRASTALVAVGGLNRVSQLVSHSNLRRRQRRKAQALVLVALAMLLLVAIVGLAIDGGSMLGQRRQAQNASDGAALAGTRVMLEYYTEMIRNNPVNDVDYGHSYELEIKRAIESYAAQNGVLTSTLQTFFVNDDKQIVTVNRGIERGGQPCGVNQARGPCQVGENGVVPWTLGAKGIDVRGTAQTDSFFMRVFGWDKVTAGASATAFMGVGAMIDNVRLVPIGLFTSTLDLENIREGQRYLLIDADLETGSGNWGWVDYTGNGTNRPVVAAWLTCGYNPSVTQATWPAWCPDSSGVDGHGPTRHYVPISPANWDPNPNATYIAAIVYGERHYGWWVRGSSGTVNANCQDFQRYIDSTGDEGVVVHFPIFDRVLPGGGTDSLYHIRIIISFRLRQGDVGCRRNDPPPTPTPCPAPLVCPTPTPSPPGGGGGTRWRIEGEAVRIYSTGSSGRHGDLRETSVPAIFLDR